MYCQVGTVFPDLLCWHYLNQGIATGQLAWCYTVDLMRITHFVNHWYNSQFIQHYFIVRMPCVSYRLHDVVK
jgi:hypothetical protein